MESFIPGLPGVRATKVSQHLIVFKQNWPSFLALGRQIDGFNTRDAGNSPDVNTIRAGTLMGKITSAGSDLVSPQIGAYANSVIDVLQGAIINGATSFTLTPAGAVELVRRIGNSGTVTITGPPAAAGTVASNSLNYSAVNTSTGVVTCSATSAAYIAGSFIGGTDGSQVPDTFIPDGYGVFVTDNDGVTNLIVPFPELPVAGIIISANLLPWPSDTSLQAYVRNNLSTLAGGKYVFDDQF